MQHYFFYYFTVVLLLVTIGNAMDSHVYVKYIPASAEEAQRQAATPTCRLQKALSPEFHFNNGRIRNLERIFRYLDALYAHPLDPVADNTTDIAPTCNRSIAFTTTFYGGGFFSHFQSYAKTMMFGLHHMNFSAPLIPQGDILGYSTTKHCDFAQRSFYCYFQDLSPCQANWSSSTVPLSPSVYRYRAFDRAIIPQEFQRHGEAFWWGALQYYVFMHLHGGIVSAYIKNDALQETPFYVKISLPRSVRVAPSRTVQAKNDQQVKKDHRALTAVGHGVSLPLPNNPSRVVIPNGGGPHVPSTINVQPRRFTRRPAAPQYRVGPRPTSTTVLTKEQRIAAVQRASQSLPPPYAVDNSGAVHPRARQYHRLVPNITRTRPLNVAPEDNLNTPQVLPLKPKESRVWSPRGSRSSAAASSSSSATDADASTRQSAPLKIARRPMATLAATWLPRIGVHVRAANIDHEEPAQIMLSEDNAALRTRSFTLADIDKRIRNSSLCQLRYTFPRPRDEFTQCFTAVELFAFPDAGNATQTDGNGTTTVAVPNSYEQWRVFNILRLAAAGKVSLLYRRDVLKYGRFLLAAGRNVQSWLANGEVLKRTPATSDAFDLYHSGMFVPMATVRQMLQLYERACHYGNDTTGLADGTANETCTFTSDDAAFVRHATGADAGGWAIPVDVLLVSDDAAVLNAVESRYHWLSFPPGLSQDILHDKRARHKYAHAGSALRQASAKSHYSTMPVQASLEVLRDVYYLVHACSVLIGSASSQVFRAAVSMGGAIGRVAEVRWLDTAAEQRVWKRRADKIAMPFPEISSPDSDDVEQAAASPYGAEPFGA
jgi:hypothetical protein